MRARWPLGRQPGLPAFNREMVKRFSETEPAKAMKEKREGLEVRA